MKHLFLAISIFLSFSATSQDDVALKGQKAPNFTIPNGTGVLRSSDLNGKIILINFFATWCVPCIQELPNLQKEVWEKYKNNPNFSLLVIGRGHSAEEVNNFKIQRKLELPMYPDQDKSIYLHFATRYIPRNYLINSKGEIVYTSRGYDPNEFQQMLKILSSLLD